MWERDQEHGAGGAHYCGPHRLLPVWAHIYAYFMCERQEKNEELMHRALNDYVFING